MHSLYVVDNPQGIVMTGQKNKILFQIALAFCSLGEALAPICASAQVFDSAQSQPALSIGQAYKRDLPLLRSLGISGKSPKVVLKSINRFKSAPEQPETLRAAKRGGIDTGGGTLVLTPSGLRLLDLVLYRGVPTGGEPSDSMVVKALPATRAFNEVGFDRITNSNSAIVQKALEAVQRWVPNSRIMGPKILRAVRRVPIYFFDGRFGVTGQRYFVPPNIVLPESQLRLGALYVEKFGTLVSRADFLALPEAHQIALIVHEALRHMQISHEAGFSTETVQRLTAMILNKPAPEETLDQVEFMKGPILAEFLSRAKVTIEVLSYSERMCSRYPKAGSHFCKISSVPMREIFKEDLLFSYVKRWDRNLNQQTDQALTDFYDGLNLSTHLTTLSVGDKLDEISEDVFALNRSTIGYSLIDFDLQEFNQTGDRSSSAYQRLRRLIDELVGSGSIVR